MLSRCLLVILSPCLCAMSRATAQPNRGTDLDWASKIVAADAERIQQQQPDQFYEKNDISARSVDDSDDDQQTDSAIISVNYRDKSGKLKTITGNADRLLLKRKRPQKTSQLKRNKGQLAAQKIRKKKRKSPRLASQILPQTAIIQDDFYDYDYDDYHYDDYNDYAAPLQNTIAHDHGPRHAPIPHGYYPEPNAYQKPQHDPYASAPYQPVKYHENPGYSHVSLETPAYKYEVEKYGDPPVNYGHNAKYPVKQKPVYQYHKQPYQQSYQPENNYVEEILPNVYIEKDFSDGLYQRPKFGYPKEQPKLHYPKPHQAKPIYDPYKQSPVKHGYPQYANEYIKSYNSEPEPYHQEPHYKTNAYYSEPHYDQEQHYKPDPYYTKPHYAPEPHYTPEPRYIPESHYVQEPHYQPEPHYKPEPHYQPEPHYIPKLHYKQEPHYAPEQRYPPKSNYPPEPHYKPAPLYHKVSPPIHKTKQESSPYHHNTAPDYYEYKPTYQKPTPTYYERSPLYEKAGPSYYKPEPVYHQPAPVYHAPSPVYYEKVHHHPQAPLIPHQQPHPTFPGPLPLPAPLPHPEPPLIIESPPPSQRPDIVFEEVPSIPPVPTPLEPASQEPTFSALIAAQHLPPASSIVIPIPKREAKVDGRAYGADLVGNFDHHTGSLGPFGFYANYYDEK